MINDQLIIILIDGMKGNEHTNPGNVICGSVKNTFGLKRQKTLQLMKLVVLQKKNSYKINSITWAKGLCHWTFLGKSFCPVWEEKILSDGVGARNFWAGSRFAVASVIRHGSKLWDDPHHLCRGTSEDRVAGNLKVCVGRAEIKAKRTHHVHRSYRSGTDVETRKRLCAIRMS